jgi:hypothetical protein
MEDDTAGGIERARNRCEALVEGPAWRRVNYDLQCSRTGWPQESLANVALCYQHVAKAKKYGELELTGGRLLSLEQKWSEDDWRRITLSVQVLSNVIRLDRSRLPHLNPPIPEEEMTEQNRIAMRTMARLRGFDEPSRTPPLPKREPPNDDPDAG